MRFRSVSAHAEPQLGSIHRLTRVRPTMRSPAHEAGLVDSAVREEPDRRRHSSIPACGVRVGGASPGGGLHTYPAIRAGVSAPRYGPVSPRMIKQQASGRWTVVCTLSCSLEPRSDSTVLQAAVLGWRGLEPQPAGYMTGADRPARAGLCCLSSSRRVLGLANALPWGLVERTGTVSDGSGYLTERSRGTGTASTSLPCVPWRYHLLRMRPVAGAGAMIDWQEAGGADRSQMDEDADRIGLGRQGKRSRSCPMAAETMRFGSRAA